MKEYMVMLSETPKKLENDLNHGSNHKWELHSFTYGPMNYQDRNIVYTVVLWRDK